MGAAGIYISTCGNVWDGLYGRRKLREKMSRYLRQLTYNNGYLCSHTDYKITNCELSFDDVKKRYNIVDYKTSNGDLIEYLTREIDKSEYKQDIHCVEVK